MKIDNIVIIGDNGIQLYNYKKETTIIETGFLNATWKFAEDMRERRKISFDGKEIWSLYTGNYGIIIRHHNSFLVSVYIQFNKPFKEILDGELLKKITDIGITIGKIYKELQNKKDFKSKIEKYIKKIH
ncbi:MAG: hypothetical protein GF317_05760 [Candidatus Lokiarchaeota archaeon]|nr:hypothetical protein [Candidatus Lokiarchaeota archaeon]